jgi:hypothetical protein
MDALPAQGSPAACKIRVRLEKRRASPPCAAAGTRHYGFRCIPGHAGSPDTSKINAKQKYALYDRTSMRKPTRGEAERREREQEGCQPHGDRFFGRVIHVRSVQHWPSKRRQARARSEALGPARTEARLSESGVALGYHALHATARPKSLKQANQP